MKLKHCIAALIFMAAINFTPSIVKAQDIGDPDDPIDTSVPFDGGISILVAAGIAYGVKKKYDSKKNTSEE